jgi:hypothetical protein
MPPEALDTDMCSMAVIIYFSILSDMECVLYLVIYGRHSPTATQAYRFHLEIALSSE